MKLSKLIFVGFIFTPATTLYAGGFLTAQKFPSTVDDISFTERNAVKVEGYEPYSGLSAYRYFELVESDEKLQQEIEEIDNTPQKPTTNTQTTTAQTTTTQSTAQQPVGNGYCAKKSQYISSGQTIPFGNPTDIQGLCSEYGWRPMQGKMDPHYGVDIGCRKEYFGSPIYATADGVVEKVIPASECKSAGNYIKIKHPSGFVTMYMHLDTMLVQPGQQVKAGCQIATMGYTGGAKIQDCPKMSIDISHLHYQIAYTGNQSSVVAPNGQKIAITHQPKLKQGQSPFTKNTKSSIDPTQFVQYKN